MWKINHNKYSTNHQKNEDKKSLESIVSFDMFHTIREYIIFASTGERVENVKWW